MVSTFDQQTAGIEGIDPARLEDADRLAAVIVAAASASGISPGSLPVIQRGPQGHTIGLVCLDGHLVVHSNPSRGECLVDIVVRLPGSALRGLEVIARRLGVATSVMFPGGEPPQFS
jgi:S-adenosylmethionine/arginine decarboxylase-like enzyme